MTVEEKLRVLARCLRELQGGEWSVREVLDFARAAGVKVRERTAYAVLYNYDLPGRKSSGRRRKGPSREAITSLEKNQLENTLGSNSGSNYFSREAISRARGKLSSNSPSSTPLFTLTSFGAGAENGTTLTVKKREKRRKIEDLTWIPGVESAVESIASRALESLSPEERLALGRYHALHFGNCTREAITNTIRGQNIAAGLTDLGSISRFKDITVREYLIYCRRVHKSRGGKPWFNPFLIKAEVEYE